eukprot:scaffold123109_cov27-Prasinocladus_malaysianus.AAC.1
MSTNQHYVSRHIVAICQIKLNMFTVIEQLNMYVLTTQEAESISLATTRIRNSVVLEFFQLDSSDAAPCWWYGSDPPGCWTQIRKTVLVRYGSFTTEDPAVYGTGSVGALAGKM